MLTYLAALMILIGGFIIGASLAAWWISANSWRSNGFDSDPRLRL